MRKISNIESHLIDNNSRKLIHGNVSATMGITSPSVLARIYGKSSSRLELLKLIEKESKFKVIWYLVFFGFALIFTIVEPSSYLNVIDLLVVLVNIDLVARGKIVGIYIGILECLLYAFISFKAGLFGEIFKCFVVLIPINIYMIITWTRNAKSIKRKGNARKKSTDADIEVRKLDSKGWLLTFVSIIALTGVSYVVLRFVLGQTISLIINSVVLSLTITQKMLSSARYMDSWLVNMGSSFIAMILWLTVILSPSGSISQLPLIAITLSVFSNDIYGYSLWSTLYNQSRLNGGKILLKRKLSINRVIVLRRKFKALKWNKSLEM